METTINSYGCSFFKTPQGRELQRVSKLNWHSHWKISPRPSLPNPAKGGTFGKACLPVGRGGWEDFTNKCCYYYETVNIITLTGNRRTMDPEQETRRACPGYHGLQRMIGNNLKCLKPFSKEQDKKQKRQNSC